VTDVQILDGDAELGQRKSKLIVIYDLHLKLFWTGTLSDGTELSGKLDIPEVSHEITLDQLHDYTYKWEFAEQQSKVVTDVYELARSRLPPALEAKFAEFPVVMMDTHGKDITVSAPASQQPSRSATPANPTPAPAPAATKQKATTASSGTKGLNTTSLSVEANLMASAEDVFSVLTDKDRIPQWSRSPAVSNPTPGSEYALFAGGVKGTYTSVSHPTQFVQTWALQNSSSWPSGHYATLTTTLNQSSDYTKVTWSMKGVPVGMEEEIERNIQGYYVGGLKSVGYVQISSRFSRPPASVPHVPLQSQNQGPRPWLTIVIVVMVLAAALSIPYLSR